MILQQQASFNIIKNRPKGMTHEEIFYPVDHARVYQLSYELRTIRQTLFTGSTFAITVGINAYGVIQLL